MDCVPELSVFKRKTLSSAKMTKRLRRFVLDNRPPESHSDPNEGDASLGDEPSSAELVCRIPEETLFQLQQIYEALEAKTGRRPAEMPPLPSMAPPRNPDDADSLQTPKKTPSKKRRREAEEPATENAKKRDDETREKRKSKKARRKSAST